MHTSLEKFGLFCQENLNDEQQDIVQQKNGVLVVHAGAGSGKTRTITARIMHLMLYHKVPFYALIALTFTNKAAREMRERVTHFLDRPEDVPFIGTFHGYCLHFLRTHKDFLDFPDFSILDSDDQEKLIKSIIARYHLAKHTTARQLGSLFSRLKNNALNGVIAYEEIPDPLLRDTFYTYEKEKAQSRCLDFDDLLLVTLRILKKEPALKAAHQERIRHILVDEYQDTNQVQHALVKEMSFDKDGTCIDSLCVVGDEDQSIYSWRGAIASMMISFKREFPQAASHALEQNYRSAQSILDTANRLIQHNTQRKPKNLWSTLEGSDRVRLLTCASAYQEGQALVALSQHYQSRGIPLKNIAVLYRSHYQSRALEEALVRHSIAYTIIGGVQFYDRQEVKDVLAYLKLTAYPYDRMALSRAINTPSRGLGDKFQELFFDVWQEHPHLDFKDIGRLLIEQGMLPPLKQEALKSFIELFEHKGQKTPGDMLEDFVKAIRYQAYLQDAYETDEAQERFENVKELISAVRSRYEQGITTVEKLLEEIALLQDYKTAQNDTDHISLMTLHAAKGLEFDTVMITGIEEGVLPSGHAMPDTDAVEEERRLLYVGITRAKQRLLLTYTRYRSTYKQLTEQRPSRFIKELSPLVTHDSSQWNMSQLLSYYGQWLNPRAPEPVYQKPTPSLSSLPSWNVNQAVHHATFGRGIIEHIEEKGKDQIYLTVRFLAGSKKIAAQFVSS